MLSTLVFLAAAGMQVAALDLAVMPIQTFFVPFKEDDIFYHMMTHVNGEKAKAPVESTIALAFSTDNTVVWYDHWEDGFELDATNKTQATTEIWGDGNAANGCVPKVVPCTDATDIIMAGQSLVINNTVPIPRDKSVIFYDGGDRMQMSFPITVTRGAYPEKPGSLMAGSTDIVEVENWGYTFTAPTGQDVGQKNNMFEYTGLFFMAAHDNTTVTLPNGTNVVLNMGDSSSVRVNQSMTLKSNEKIQVHLITGDVMSIYEMRWYSLLPDSDWNNEYLSPVGDSVGKTKMFMYNPQETAMQINVETMTSTVPVTLAPKSSAWTAVITTGTGAIVRSADKRKFIALSLTDTEDRTQLNQWTFGEWYDWGFTVLPTEILTSQVLVGWGYACTNKNCFGQRDRSVIWVTPMADADIYIDYKNGGENRTVFSDVKRLSSNKYVDIDQDMSGALIYAVKPKSGPTGEPVKIAAAWGQDPSVSRNNQSISLDLGTVVRPFPSVRASKSVDKAIARTGEVLTYTIKLVNMGQSTIQKDALNVFDALDAMVSYIPGTTTIMYNRAPAKEGDELVVMPAIPVADSATGTPFPLDRPSGYKVSVDLPKRGGSIDITFQVLINGPINDTHVYNRGDVVPPALLGNPIPFDAVTELIFDPLIALTNKVYLGSDNGASCESAVEFVQDIAGADVVYCFNVTNTGTTYLSNFTLNDAALLYTNNTLPLLPPGKSTMVFFKSTIAKPLVNMAVVVATPAFVSGAPIPGLNRVNASDPSEVGTLIAAPGISIDNEVALGSDKALCGTELAVENVTEFAGALVMYCFNVTNTGNTYLDSVSIKNGALSFANASLGMLAPGEWKMVPVPRKLTADLVNNATVVANPVFKDGKDIPNLPDVTDTDPSFVNILLVTPKVNIENTVYLGNQDGLCKTDIDVEVVTGNHVDDVIFCFVISNTGDSHLNITSVVDPLLNFTKLNLGVLAPKESITISYPSKIYGNLINNATVLANPVYPDGKDIPYLKDVTDTDPSEVKETLLLANVTIQNTVYVGSDNGALCPGKELAEAALNTSIVYCFNITNTGTSYLQLLTLEDKELKFTQSRFPEFLAPGQSVMIPVPGVLDGNYTNKATVVANPITPSGIDIATMKDVTATDPSAIKPKMDGQPREFYNPPTSGNKTCLDNAYEDAFNKSDELVCSSKDVYMEQIKTLKPKTCNSGEVIYVDLDGSIRVNSARYDLGWYIATDGGDALDGSCTVNGLREGGIYNVTNRPGGTIKKGSINWNDAKEGKDTCGNVVLDTAGEGGTISNTPIATKTPIICKDDNKDGMLDIAICFTWRTATTDGLCTMSRDDPLTKGRLADMYPGTVDGCNCQRYQVPGITVTPPPVDPC